jgi:alginate O-acetyltransferase complex protein AlgI
MYFNSLDFAVFLPIVFLLYWYLLNKNLKLQNLLVVIASYVFYGWWEWKFLFLVLFSTIVDYFIGYVLAGEENQNKRKVLLWTSITVNIGFLWFFKYYNFFIDNFVTAFSFFGMPMNSNSLNIILPVGISFYTFQTLSYTIDVYNKKLEPTKDFIAFSAFVSFFPQLVAGPIERATNLLPQFHTKRSFDYSKAADGMRQILWGLFMKVVIADNCAEYANLIFNNSGDHRGSTLILGALFFTFQIYCDFSGYSNIAIGTSRLFGFNLKQNFKFPYFSRDIAEFWRNWHISLSTWFRDYLYIPLGGSQVGLLKKIRNIFIIFIVSGFWHGANWTFIVWGILHAFYFLPLLLMKTNRKNIEVVAQNKAFPNVKEFLQMVSTFCITAFAWIFFRAENINHSLSYILRLFSGLFSKQYYVETYNLIFWEIGYALPILIILFMIMEWVGREQQYALEKIGEGFPRLIRWLIYSVIIVVIIFFINQRHSPFIYFQF